MPSRVVPMAPVAARIPFTNRDWVFEPKWDGYRAICFVQDGVVRFVSRNRKTLDQRFPQLLTVAKSIKAEKAVIDGEVVALDASGLPCFEGLRSREMNCVVVYYAFDLLYLDGRDHTSDPLLTRKAQLKRLLPKSNVGRIRYTDHVVGPGEKFFQQLERLRLEGMVAKRANSIYVGGRTRAWLKIKTEAGRAEMRRRAELWKPQ